MRYKKHLSLAAFVCTGFWVWEMGRPVQSAPNTLQIGTESFPVLLIPKEEFVPGWKLTKGSFVVGAREFIYCRGKGFAGEPPDTPGFRERYKGKTFQSLGRLNNAVLQGLERADISDTQVWESALHEFVRLSDSFPDFWPVIYNRARLHSILSQHKEALLYWRRAVRLLPEYAGVHYHLARTAAVLHRDTEARAHFRLAIQQNPKRLRPLVGLGDFFYRQNSRHHAELYYQKVLQQNPKHIGAMLGMLRIWISRNEQNLARRKLLYFLSDYYDAKKATLQTVPLFYYLAELHFHLRDYKRALTAYEEALRFPESSLYLEVSKRSLQKRIERCKRILKNT